MPDFRMASLTRGTQSGGVMRGLTMKCKGTTADMERCKGE